MEENNIDVPIESEVSIGGGSVTIIEETYIYDFSELLEELKLLREDFNNFNIKYDELSEQQQIFFYENIKELQTSNQTLTTTLDYTSFLLISFLIFSGILIGYILGKKD